MTDNTVSKVCAVRGIHCWHLIQTFNGDDRTTYNRKCCWCGENWVEVIVHERHSGWSNNPNAHPEHGSFQPRMMLNG